MIHYLKPKSHGQVNRELGLSQRLTWKLQGTNNHPRPLCSGGEEGLRGCRPTNFKALWGERGRATKHRHILHNVELDLWRCHTNHVTAVNFVCV